MNACALCAEPIRDTAVVCAREAEREARRLREAADLWPELTVTLARLGRSGDPTPRAGSPAPAEPVRAGSGDLRHYGDQVAGWPAGLPVDLAASETMWAVTNTVGTWARLVADITGAVLPTTVPDTMRWLADRLDWVRYREWAGQAIDELGEVPALVWRALDRAPAKRYLGPCMAPVESGECEGELYCRPGAEWVTCPACGGTHQVPERRAWLENQVRARSFTAAEIQGAFGIRADRIRQWASRGRIAQRGVDLRGVPLYRVSEVLDLVAKMGSRERAAA